MHKKSRRLVFFVLSCSLLIALGSMRQEKKQERKLKNTTRLKNHDQVENEPKHVENRSDRVEQIATKLNTNPTKFRECLARLVTSWSSLGVRTQRFRASSFCFNRGLLEHVLICIRPRSKSYPKPNKCGICLGSIIVEFVLRPNRIQRQTIVEFVHRSKSFSLWNSPWV